MGKVKVKVNQPRIPNQKPAVSSVPAEPAGGDALTLEVGQEVPVPEELLNGCRKLDLLVVAAQQRLGKADFAVAQAEAARNQERLAYQEASNAWFEKARAVCRVLGADLDDTAKGWNFNQDKGTITRTK